MESQPEEQPAPAEQPAQQKRPSARSRNVWERHTRDGKDRSHVHPVSPALFGLRVAEAVLAVVFLVLASYSAYTLNFGSLPGFVLAFFTFAWTAIYFIWLLVSIIAFPMSHHWIALVVLESLTNVFWLATWTTFATYAGDLNLAGAGTSAAVTRRRGPGLARGAEPEEPRPEARSSTDTTTTVGLSPASPTSVSVSSTTLSASQQAVSAAEILIGVDAGIGAIIWVLFVATVILTAVAVHKHRGGRRSAV